MKPCPRCRKGYVQIEMVLVAKPILDYSISGQQSKVVAEEKARVTCSECSLEVFGILKDPEVDEDGNFTGGYFVQDT